MRLLEIGMSTAYWNETVEKADRKALETQQLEDPRSTLSAAFATPFYKERLAKAGICSPADIRTLNDFEKIPFTT